MIIRTVRGNKDDKKEIEKVTVKVKERWRGRSDKVKRDGKGDR